MLVRARARSPPSPTAAFFPLGATLIITTFFLLSFDKDALRCPWGDLRSKKVFGEADSSGGPVPGGTPSMEGRYRIETL